MTKQDAIKSIQLNAPQKEVQQGLRDLRNFLEVLPDMKWVPEPDAPAPTYRGIHLMGTALVTSDGTHFAGALLCMPRIIRMPTEYAAYVFEEAKKGL